MIIYVENIVTDLRKFGVKLSDSAFDMINTYIDIQNSTVIKRDIDRWQEIKGTTCLFVYGANIVAVYSGDKFMWNPKKIKISDFGNYDIYQIIEAGVNVQNRRDQRRYNRQGLVPAKDAPYVGVPKTDYIWDKDWNPETNKVYYTKLLTRKHLGQYAQALNDAYDVVTELIEQRKDRLTGKRTSYDRMIGQIVSLITKIEDLLVGVERDVNADSSKLKAELKKLPNLLQKANDFMASEAAEYQAWGKRRQIPLTPIER